MAKNNGVAVASRSKRFARVSVPARAAKKAKPAVKTKAGKRVKRVYFFGNGKAEGNATMKDLLGGKGANLAEMTLVPLPVPRLTITTENAASTTKPAMLTRGPEEEVARTCECRTSHAKVSAIPESAVVAGARARSLHERDEDTVLNIGLSAKPSRAHGSEQQPALRDRQLSPLITCSRHRVARS